MLLKDVALVFHGFHGSHLVFLLLLFRILFLWLVILDVELLFKLVLFLLDDFPAVYLLKNVPSFLSDLAVHGRGGVGGVVLDQVLSQVDRDSPIGRVFLLGHVGGPEGIQVRACVNIALGHRGLFAEV